MGGRERETYRDEHKHMQKSTEQTHEATYTKKRNSPIILDVRKYAFLLEACVRDLKPCQKDAGPCGTHFPRMFLYWQGSRPRIALQ